MELTPFTWMHAHTHTRIDIRMHELFLLTILYRMKTQCTYVVMASLLIIVLVATT